MQIPNDVMNIKIEIRYKQSSNGDLDKRDNISLETCFAGLQTQKAESDLRWNVLWHIINCKFMHNTHMRTLEAIVIHR